MIISWINALSQSTKGASLWGAIPAKIMCGVYAKSCVVCMHFCAACMQFCVACMQFCAACMQFCVVCMQFCGVCRQFLWCVYAVFNRSHPLFCEDFSFVWNMGVCREAYWRGAFHSQKISYTLGKNPFVFKKNPPKIRRNPFVMKKSRTLFRKSEMPLAYWPMPRDGRT